MILGHEPLHDRQCPARRRLGVSQYVLDGVALVLSQHDAGLDPVEVGLGAQGAPGGVSSRTPMVMVFPLPSLAPELDEPNAVASSATTAAATMVLTVFLIT